MRGILIILLFTSAILADTEYGSFSHDGITRTYITYLPENIQGNSPLVINLHGYGQLADTFMNNTFMRGVADTAGFIVCYPRAIDEKWNSGLGDIPGYPCPNVDDVGFISALIDTLLSNYSIDPNQLYVCGHSNGGFMTFRVFCELNDRFSKAASVSGAMTTTTVAGCGSALPKPMLLMHGTSDPVVPYYGGVAGVTSAEATLQYWLDFNGCSQAADTIALPDTDPTDGCNTEVMIYKDCSGNQSLVFYKMHNAGHYWPGVDHNWTSQGPANTDFLADVEIWRFFDSDSFEIRGVWAHELWMDTSFVEPGAGALTIGAAITNTDDHSYAAHAVLFDANSTVIDSVELFDDGEHADGAAGDGIAGAFLPSPQAESFFFVQASTVDMETGDYLGPHDYVSFTTVGPLVQDGYQIVNDDYPNPGDHYRFHLDILNQSDSITVPNVSVQLRTIDSLVVADVTRKNVGNLAPGQVDDARYLAVDIAEFEPTDTLNLPIGVDIYSNNILYWVDTLWLIIRPVGLDEGSNLWPSDYALIQNYPNPFNPTTTIQYSLSEAGSVKLTVFDMRGQEVTTLLNTSKSPGNYEVQWNGMDQSGNPVSTGVYFCRLVAGSYSKTIKMVYLR